jgi:hypothetical protein
MDSLEKIGKIDRRIVYMLVIVALSIPLVLKIQLPPAKMDTAESYFNQIESLRAEDGIVLIAADWGPNTLGENLPQTRVTIEHLMRRRIPFALITIYSLGSPFLDQLPRDIAQELQSEMPDEKWEYGIDWVNWGYRIQPSVMIQGLAKSDDLHEYLKADAYGSPISSIPVMKNIKTIKDITLLVEITGLSGALSAWIQFFQGEDYRPPFVHGCTSITIPEAYIFYSSKQLIGLFEGIAGAAWYDKILKEHFPNRTDQTTQIINSSLAFAHLIIIFMIILGNVSVLLQRRKK